MMNLLYIQETYREVDHRLMTKQENPLSQPAEQWIEPISGEDPKDRKKGASPRIPPKRKTSNVSASAGLNSTLAEGSNRQTRDLRSAKISSTLRCSTLRPGVAARSSGICREVGTELSRNLLPEACASRAMQPYSRADQAPNSGSRCSTTMVTGPEEEV